MKTYIGKISRCLLVMFVILFSSCEDILETLPSDRISSEVYWKNEQDAAYAANAIYNYLNGTRIFVFDGMTDILHANTQFSDYASMERGEYDSNMEFVQTVWSDSYKGIRAVDYFLENVTRIPVKDRQKLDILSAEVRVIRAYLYMQLVMLYGDVPLVEKTIESIQEGKDVKRNSTEEVWNFINKELSEAASILPVSSEMVGQVTKGAALALSARGYLYQSKWKDAAIAAKAVIDLNKYDLYESYKDLFTYIAENNKEVILDKQQVKDVCSNDVFKFLAPFSLKKQGPTFVPTKAIFDAYRMTNGKMIHEEGSGFSNETQYEDRDPRLGYSIYLPGDELPNGSTYAPELGSGSQDEVGNTYLATSLGYNIKKYINKEDFANPANCGINIILLRYAEVLLTYAEAKIEMNDIDDSVLDAINQLRRRSDVNMPSVEAGLNQRQMRDLVRNERMVELAFEGHRLFDCRRWKIAEDVFPGKVSGLVYQDEQGKWNTVSIEGFLKVFKPEKHYLWPIPQKEIDLNPNFEQNPNW